MWGSNPLHHREKPEVLSSLPDVHCCARNRGYAEMVSKPLLPAFSFAQGLVFTQPDFFFKEKILHM